MAFQVGDKVHVDFDAVVIGNGDTAGNRLFTYTIREIDEDNGKAVGPVHYVYLSEENAFVVEQPPENWPPQAGDIWEAGGNEYFAYVSGYGDDVIAFPFNGAVNGREAYGGYGSHTLDEFKALKPRLVRRAAPAVTLNFADGGFVNTFTDMLTNYTATRIPPSDVWFDYS